MKATVIYCGSNVNDLLPLYDKFVKLAIKGMKTGENYFNDMVLDIEAIEATKQKDYNPFKVTQYDINN